MQPYNTYHLVEKLDYERLMLQQLIGIINGPDSF